MNTKEHFANRVLDRLPMLDKEQRNCVKTVILDEMDSYVIYTPDEAAEIIKEPLALLDKFLMVKKGEGLAASTMGLYKQYITKFIGSVVKQITEVTADDIRNYLNSKVTNGLSLPAANTVRASLSSFFTWVFNEEYISRNPMAKVKRMKHDRELQPAFNEIEVDALRRFAAKEPRNLALIDFLLSTGCRVSEACDANISDVSFAQKKLYVIGKGNKKRVVYLTDVAVCSLELYLRTRKDDNEALFVNLRAPHERMTPRGIQNALREIGNGCHVKNVHPHRFRHTCCTRLLCRGMSIQDVSRILGHVNVNTTMWYNNTSESYVDSKFRQYSF